MWRRLIMKIEETIEKVELKIQRKTVQMQKKQIKMQQSRIKNHEKTIKQLMKELGYSYPMITATILANYKPDDANNIPVKE